MSDTPIDIADYLAGNELGEYSASFEIYSPQPTPLACIEHQHRERAHRKTYNTHDLPDSHSNRPGLIPETYSYDLYLGGFLIIIDDRDWRKDFHGPLFARFDIRPQRLRIVEPGLNAEDAGVYEQIEICINRQEQPHQVPGSLKHIGMREDWEEFWDETRKKFAAPAPLRPHTGETQLPSTTNNESLVEDLPTTDGVSSLRVTSAQAREKRDLVYDFYAIFQPSSPSDFSLESLARRFTTSLVAHLRIPSPSFAFTFYGLLPNICSAVAHHQFINTVTASEVGYLMPQRERRIYPHYGREAGGAVYIEEMEYRNFSVVIDKENWADEGVCFLWEGWKEQPEDLYRNREGDAMGRGEGMEWLAGRLSGRL